MMFEVNYNLMYHIILLTLKYPPIKFPKSYTTGTLVKPLLKFVILNVTPKSETPFTPKLFADKGCETINPRFHRQDLLPRLPISRALVGQRTKCDPRW